MSRKKIRWQWLSAVIISLMMFSTPALAGDLNPSAPPGPTMKTLDQIPPTWDQILPASERFKLVMGGAAVLDKETGLVWEKSPPDGLYAWAAAISQCYNKTVGGRKGWRLPAIQELASLVDPLVDTSVNGTPKLPIGHPFSNLDSRYFWWSATTSPYNTTWALALAIGQGGIYADDGGVAFLSKIGTENVWCVRGGQGNDAQ